MTLAYTQSKYTQSHMMIHVSWKLDMSKIHECAVLHGLFTESLIAHRINNLIGIWRAFFRQLFYEWDLLFVATHTPGVVLWTAWIQEPKPCRNIWFQLTDKKINNSESSNQWCLQLDVSCQQFNRRVYIMERHFSYSTMCSCWENCWVLNVNLWNI